MKHTQEQFDILAATSNETNNDALEDLSANYDAIYIHPVSFGAIFIWLAVFWVDSILTFSLISSYLYFHLNQSTFELSKLAVGSTIELVDSILRNEVQNGMAIIRPPGHHAMKAEYNGYCFFNNVAIAAQHALNNRNVSMKWCNF